MTPPDHREAEERRARIDQMIERYRKARQRRVLRRAIRLWRLAEAEPLLAHCTELGHLDAVPPRFHDDNGRHPGTE